MSGWQTDLDALDKIEKLEGRPLVEQKKIIYGWVKTSNISYAVFNRLLGYIAEGLNNEESNTQRTE